jgi:hypothetical protein
MSNWLHRYISLRISQDQKLMIFVAVQPIAVLRTTVRQHRGDEIDWLRGQRRLWIVTNSL